MHFFRPSEQPPPEHKRSPKWASYVRRMKEQTRLEFEGKKHETPVFGEIAGEFFRTPRDITAIECTPKMEAAWLQKKSRRALAGAARPDLSYFSSMAGMDIPPAPTPDARYKQAKRLGAIVLGTLLPSLPPEDQSAIREDFETWDPSRSSFTFEFPEVAEAAFNLRHLNSAPIADLMPDEPPMFADSSFDAAKGTSFHRLAQEALQQGGDVEIRDCS